MTIGVPGLMLSLEIFGSCFYVVVLEDIVWFPHMDVDAYYVMLLIDDCIVALCWHIVS